MRYAFFLIGTTIILGGITGFADFNQGAFFRGLGGRIMQGAQHCLVHACGSSFLALGLENRRARFYFCYYCRERTSYSREKNA